MPETDFHQFSFLSAQLNEIYVQQFPDLMLGPLSLLTGALNCNADILLMIVRGGREQEMDARGSLCPRTEGSLHTLPYLGEGRDYLS